MTNETPEYVKEFRRKYPRFSDLEIDSEGATLPTCTIQELAEAHAKQLAMRQANDKLALLESFLIAKVEEAKAAYKKELAEKVEGLAFKDPNEAGQFALHSSGYNQAIEEVLAMLEV